MINFLVKTFIKNSEDIENPQVRQSYGVFAGIVGIICNVILFSFKFMAGIITGAVSISADAFNNLSDAGSSVITLIGFKMAGKSPDSEHPYGHGRVEYLSGLLVASIIIIMAVELFKSSVEKIIHPEVMEFSLLSVIILVGSILMKMWMALFNTKLGNKISSSAMKATATDSMSDCIATTVVLVSLFISSFSGYNIDGIAGVIVAVFVFLAGIDAANDTIQPLLGKPPEKEFVNEITSCILEDKRIMGIHDMIVHDYGPGRVFVTVHAEVPYEMDMLKAHDIIDMAEHKVSQKFHCGITIHMDPVVTDDASINELKSVSQQVIHNIDPNISMHDFRVVTGPHRTNLIFDIVVPFGYSIPDEVLKKKIRDDIFAVKDNCYANITIDKSYLS